MIAKDKLLHFIVGFFLFNGLALVMPFLYAFIITAIIAIGKEINDLKSTGIDYIDILFTLLPGAIIYGLWYQ
jgi:hypothetical protein